MISPAIPYKNGVQTLLKREKDADEKEKKRVALPPVSNPDETFAVRLKTNPFSLPPGNAWIDLWKTERKKEKERRKSERKRKVHQKHTFSSRSAYSTLPAIKHMCKNIDSELMSSTDGSNSGPYNVLSRKAFHVRPVHREFKHDFIQRKRDIFLAEYALQTKREEVEKHKAKALSEDQKVVRHMNRLHEDAVLFDDFLKATDDAAVEAMKLAEKEAKLKIEKVAEYKKGLSRLMALKSEISQKDEILAEYLSYKSFLIRVNHNYQNNDSLPLDGDAWAAKEEEQRKEFVRKREQRNKLETSDKDQKQKLLSRRTNRSRRALRTEGDRAIGKVDSKQAFSKLMYPEEWEEEKNTAERTDSKSPEAEVISKESTRRSKRRTPVSGGGKVELQTTLPLKYPQLLPDIIHEYEEKNLNLIYRCQSSEDEREYLAFIVKNTKKRLLNETEQLKQYVKKIKKNIKNYETKADEFCLMHTILSEGTKEQDSKQALNIVTGEVEKVYKTIFTFAIGTMDAILMLTCIEQRMDDLIELMESLPQSAVQEYQRMLDKERRWKMREEIKEVMKNKQEERAKKAVERANAASFKRVGRKLMFRSKPLKSRNQLKKAIRSTSVESFDFFTE